MESLRIPVQYLANLLTAGDTQPVLLALKRMLAMRHFKRRKPWTVSWILGRWKRLDLTEAQAQEMYRYLAIANYEDRFVVPSSHREQARDAFPEKSGLRFYLRRRLHGSDSQFNLFNQPPYRCYRRHQQNGAAPMIELVIVSRLLEYPDAALWQHQQSCLTLSPLRKTGAGGCP